jgi:MinD-like ATPase involved in chromosome partitioning or flagellar assembly
MRERMRMSSLVAVWGCPDSGKTTFCVKLAKAINEKYGSQVLCVFTDPVTPALPVLFPYEKTDNLLSIGDVLSKTEITQDTILKNLVTVGSAKGVGFLGFNGGENLHTYPEFSREKVTALFDAAAAFADVIIVDCGSSLVYPMPSVAVCMADVVIRMCKPDLKAISFFASQSPLYTDPRYRMDEHLSVMTVTEQDAYIPIEDAAQHFKCENRIIPYT